MEELGPAVFPQILGRTEVEPAPHHDRTATLMSWNHTRRQTRGIDLRRPIPLALEAAKPLNTRTHSARADECSGTRQARGRARRAQGGCGPGVEFVDDAAVLSHRVEADVVSGAARIVERVSLDRHECGTQHTRHWFVGPWRHQHPVC